MILILSLAHYRGILVGLKKVAILVKVNGDSSGKPSAVPAEANSRRSEAKALRRDLGCRGQGRAAPLSSAFVEVKCFHLLLRFSAYSLAN